MAEDKIPNKLLTEIVSGLDRDQQAEHLKYRLGVLLSEKDSVLKTCTVEKGLFIEMAFCFIAKHGS